MSTRSKPRPDRRVDSSRQRNSPSSATAVRSASANNCVAASRVGQRCRPRSIAPRIAGLFLEHGLGDAEEVARPPPRLGQGLDQERAQVDLVWNEVEIFHAMDEQRFCRHAAARAYRGDDPVDHAADIAPGVGELRVAAQRLLIFGDRADEVALREQRGREIVMDRRRRRREA